VIVRLTADCPLHDPEVISHMIELYLLGGYDFLSNSEPLPSTWPDGVDVSIFSITALKNAWKSAIKPSEREHVTFHFWNNPNKFSCKRIDNVDDLSRYRLTIDYPEDLILISKVIEHFEKMNPSRFGKVTMADIINFLEINPEIYRVNSKYSHGVGWVGAFNRDKALGF
jgi:spore coat polysaccharide biosynthesis protein SpsF